MTKVYGKFPSTKISHTVKKEKQALLKKKWQKPARENSTRVICNSRGLSLYFPSNTALPNYFPVDPPIYLILLILEGYKVQD